MAHDPRRPIGKGIFCETDSAGATWVKSLVCEPVAVKLLRRSVLRDYSVGIANPRIRPDPTGRAVNGIIYSGQIIELTLCDVGSNPSCGVTLVKARKDGTAEYVGKAFGEKAPKLAAVTGQADIAGWLDSADSWVREQARVFLESSQPTQPRRPGKVTKSGKPKVTKSQMRAIGLAAARELSMAPYLDSSDPVTREQAYLEAVRSGGLYL